MPKGKRRGSRPWRPGVRSLTSAAPWQNQTAPKRRSPARVAPPSRIAYGDAWKGSREWLSAEDFAIVKDAMSRRVKPTR